MRKLLCWGVVLVSLALASGAQASTPVAVWPSASELTLPTGATTTAGNQSAQLNSVTCTSVGNCVAVGWYVDESGDVQAMAAMESGGTWGQASELSLPTGANTTAGDQAAALVSVTCTSVGNCVAGGHYTDTSGSFQAMVATESGGTWGQASELSLPAGATTTPGDQGASVDSVACTSVGNCVASGYYADTNGLIPPMVATESGGTWGQASEVSLPPGANTTAGDQGADLISVTCPSVGDCVAGGWYADTAGAVQAMVATESGGTWGQASELSLPTGANTTAGDQAAALVSVTCTSVGNCVAGGHYTDTNGSLDFQAMVATESDGTWGQASEVSLPPGANTTVDGQAASVDSVVCTSVGNCVASGYYTDTNGSNDAQAMVATESGGTWGQASELSLPAGANTTAGGQNADVHSVACTSVGNCVGVGYYVDANGDTEAMVLTSVASSLAVGTSTLPSAVVGSAYSAQLVSSGGTGGDVWSVNSGSLPAGLSLNASTGVMSGVPTVAGTSSFTVSVSDPAPPVQHASATFSIVVGAAPPTTPAPPTPVAPAPPPPVEVVTVSSYGTPTSATTQSGATTTVASSAGVGVTATVAVPAGALPAGTVVSVYPVVNSAALTTALNSNGQAGQAFVLSFAVVWQTPNGTSPKASVPITMTVSDPGIRPGDTIYALTSRSLVAVGYSSQVGIATITFSTDPLFVVAAVTGSRVSLKDDTAVMIVGYDKKLKAGTKLTVELIKSGKVSKKASVKVSSLHGFTWKSPKLKTGNYTVKFLTAGKVVKTATIKVAAAPKKSK
jgi:hypothetical protein